MYLKKNKPYFTALGSGGVYLAYPVWPQRSLLYILRVPTPIMSLVFTSLPWSQRNRNKYALFDQAYISEQLPLLSWLAVHSNTNFFTSGPLCFFFLISYFSLGVFGPGLNILFSPKTLVSYTDHSLSGSSYDCAISDEQAACSSHLHIHK